MRFLVRLSMEPNRFVKAREIARKEDIPERYLRQIIILMERGGLIRSFRGPKGGYILSRSPQEITLSEVFEVLEGSLSFAPCLEDERVCQRVSYCAAREFWKKVNLSMRKTLETITLKDLAETQRLLEVGK